MAKNLSKLTKKTITNKKGHRTTVWVKMGEDPKKQSTFRRANEFFTEGVNGKELHSLFGGKFDGDKFDKWLESKEEGTKSDAQYIRLLDFMARKNLGIDSEKYANKPSYKYEEAIKQGVKDSYDDFMENAKYKKMAEDRDKDRADKKSALESRGKEGKIAQGKRITEGAVEAMATKSGVRKEAVAKFVADNNLRAEKMIQDMTSKKLNPSDLMTAVVGKPINHNPIMREIIQKYGNATIPPSKDAVKQTKEIKEGTYGLSAPHKKLIEKLGEKDKLKLASNTYAVKDGDNVHVKLYDTNVVTHTKNGDLKLDSGGFMTNTTKSRMNAYSDAQVYQQKGEWFVDYKGKTHDFKDGMLLKKLP